MGDFWDPTVQMFGSLLERPQMSGKLLTRPPFKYIFDIIMETQKVTGYPKGLYNKDDLKYEFYEFGAKGRRNNKIHFLEKIIDLTQMTLKERIIVSPYMITAGLEPELTNLFLQAIYRAAMSGNNFQPYIKKIHEFEQQKPKEAIVKQMQIVDDYNNYLKQENQILTLKVDQEKHQQLNEDKAVAQNDDDKLCIPKIK